MTGRGAGLAVTEQTPHRCAPGPGLCFSCSPVPPGLGGVAPAPPVLRMRKPGREQGSLPRPHARRAAVDRAGAGGTSTEAGTAQHPHAPTFTAAKRWTNPNVHCGRIGNKVRSVQGEHSARPLRGRGHTPWCAEAQSRPHADGSQARKVRAARLHSQGCPECAGPNTESRLLSGEQQQTDTSLSVGRGKCSGRSKC